MGAIKIACIAISGIAIGGIAIGGIAIGGIGRSCGLICVRAVGFRLGLGDAHCPGRNLNWSSDQLRPQAYLMYSLSTPLRLGWRSLRSALASI